MDFNKSGLIGGIDILLIILTDDKNDMI